jgi:O-antigen ligase
MTLAVTPWTSLEPISLPKFTILGVCGVALFGVIAPFLRKIFFSDTRFLICAVTLFISCLVLTFLFSDSSFWPQIYGTFGRNTGLISYMCLATMLLSTALVSSYSFVGKLLWALIFSGFFNALYGVVQWSGNDPANWRLIHNSIIGTLGNPNFVSAYLGIAAVAALAFGLDNSRSFITRIIPNTSVAISLFVIQKSNSSQGLLIFALGAVFIFYWRFLHLFSKLIRKIYLTLVCISLALGTLGVLNKGPLSPYLYEASVSVRGDYWRAGWQMTLSHPLFGIGLDSYGDWYRFSRDEAAVLRAGPGVVTNSAHNVFLDISSNGGFILLLSYLLIISLIFKSSWRVLRRSQTFNAISVALVSSWVAYFVQSVISINQLGLAIWGWVLGGAIIGYDLYQENLNPTDTKRNGRGQTKVVPESVVLTGTLGFMVGMAVSIWPFAQDLNFRSALESGEVNRIEAAVKMFPRNNQYLTYSANILLQNKLEDKALEFAKRATSANPRDFNAWSILAKSSTLGEKEKRIALEKMKELDPFNQTIKQP